MAHLKHGNETRNNVWVMEKPMADPHWVPIPAWDKEHADHFKQSLAYKTNKSAYDARRADSLRGSPSTSVTTPSTSMILPNPSAGLPFTATINVEKLAEKVRKAASTSTGSVVVDFRRIYSSAREVEVLTLAFAKINITLHHNFGMIMRGFNMD
ncbi:hypothetical protein G6011_07065 [Alternaria panax]|uniref:Uncharacterized protein n=1 Tax=Alternaria panax TaxID=48097 RepID=A0AAD4FDW8_9PLEO|nr:hypothetical protein G6011_07065 [Alternaria panax]